MGLFEVMIIGLIAGAATAVGGLISFVLPIQNKSCLELTLGFAGGIMVGLSLFQLMPEGYFFAQGVFSVALGFSFGIIIMFLISLLFPADCDISTDEQGSLRKTGGFISLSIALHNLPEGIAMGVGFAGHSTLGFLIAIAILLHNIPEGIGIGVPLRKGGIGVWMVLAVTLVTGLITPMGALIGWKLGIVSPSYLGWGMGLAAGAMVFIAFTKLLFFKGYWNYLGAFCGILLTFLIA